MGKHGHCGPNPDVDGNAFSKDQCYLPNTAAAIESVKFIGILAIRDHSQLSHSRWSRGVEPVPRPAFERVGTPIPIHKFKIHALYMAAD
ncbi:hypothetical protein AVEN_181848-1 [Araneus ventricosus]|uniref:Uncharacterized protein n=1 Tax=Araneus ventricosus TaxID=182803 RepID=A0A4Y2RMD5_ARAVE|nr:hypothetical protein AVEN_181848-1 [Araneus ventricosus]